MKRKGILISIVVAAVVGGVGFGAYWWGMNRGMEMSAGTGSGGAAVSAAGEQKAADGTATGGRKVLYWHDPMVPQQKFDKPGKSPFMNMMLEPVYADEGTDEGKVTISPRVQQNLGIRTAEVTRGSVTPALEAVGSIAYNERDVAVVQARASGFVEKLFVRAPLDPVRRGQPLAELYVPDWVAAQEEFLALRQMKGEGLETLIDGARQRMRLAGMMDAQIRQVEEKGVVQPRLTVVAPVSGV
ncbi:MAG: efflux RND transporter periplasmic adaptor subunit, partial [Betaproteobacteria bacterium]|nr:efflux RND transporter periplasmic adaptor subunit [Betaproteobacteria bacterium]